jgi:hypothetical protein
MLRLSDGAADVRWGADLFTGQDARFGVLAGVDGLESGFGDTSPAYSITLHPAAGSAIADLSSPTFQGAAVNLWLAVIDQASGTVTATPEPLFFGEVDVTMLSMPRGGRILTIDAVSAFEDFFADDEGQSLSDAYHQGNWPGELGLSNISGVTIRDAWGTKGAGRATATTSSSLGGRGQFENVAF